MMNKKSDNSFFKKITKTDLQANNPLYTMLAVYLGIILFVLNVMLMNVCSISNVSFNWRENCSGKVSIEVPFQISSNENILKIKNIILDIDPSSAINIVDKNKIISSINEYCRIDSLSGIEVPAIIEVKNFHSKFDVNSLKSFLNEVSDDIIIYDHTATKNPGIKITNFIEFSYCSIVTLIVISLICFICIYSYQNIMFNKENIYILTMLCARKEYIFKQMKIHLLVYFLMSFIINIFFSGLFLAYLLHYHSWAINDVLFNIMIILSMPLLVFMFLLLATKYTTYFVIKRISFDCF